MFSTSVVVPADAPKVRLSLSPPKPIQGVPDALPTVIAAAVATLVEMPKLYVGVEPRFCGLPDGVVSNVECPTIAPGKSTTLVGGVNAGVPLFIACRTCGDPEMHARSLTTNFSPPNEPTLICPLVAIL